MKKAEKGALDYWKISGSDQKKHFWGALAFAERGEEPMTAGGRNFIGSEVSRNKRPPLCGAAPIEAAEGSHPAPRAIGKAPASCRCPIRAEHFISYPNPDSYLLAVYSAVCFHETGFPRVLLFDWEHMLWYDYL